jgi:Type VI secretion, TssG
VTKFKKIAAELNALSIDVRAEVLLAQAMESGLKQKDFFTQANAFFYRTHVHDLYKASMNDQNSYVVFLALQLSRPGLYDALPEGIFFQADEQTKKIKSAEEMAEEYRINKKKETEVRKFFAPFENEFFLQTIKNEIVETNLLQGLRSGWLKEYFIDFWKLPQNIPTSAALVLVMFLPYVHRIAGNLQATAGVLQKIINEPVKIDLMYERIIGAEHDYNELGKHDLGSELICGESFKEQYPVAIVNIGPLEKTKAYQYVEGGNYFPLLQTFYNYFIPANADVKTTILLKQVAEKFVLNQKDDAPLLGISSVL